ncbi:MAG TPA: exodeoxyribonuclease VII small subunit [Firmicutes bacterium]|nr:exodeoxyribonuclease VII small subunit [Bacillota bacterium]
MGEKKPGEARGGETRGQEALTFEQAFGRLKAVVAELEQADLPLDRALALFEEGIGLSRICKARLDEAEGRVQQLLQEADGRLVEAPLGDGATGSGDEP